LCKFGWYGNVLCSPKIFISIFEFSDPVNPTTHANIVSISLKNWNLRNFGLFWPTFGCHGNSLGSVENSGSIFEFNNLVFTCDKFLHFLQENEISAILAYFCPNLVDMATPLVSFKIEIAYLKSPTQKPNFLCDFWHITEISAILAYFCSNLVVLATSLAPLKILIAYSKSPLYMRKISRFLTENWWVQFFAQFWSPWQPPWLPLNFIYHIWILRPRKPYYSCEKVLDFLRRTEDHLPYFYYKKNGRWGAAPSICNVGSSWPCWSEIADFQSIFARCASALTSSKKFNTNRKSTKRFPMSLK